MKAFISLSDIELIADSEFTFNWANLKLAFPAKDQGNDCTMEIHIRVPKEHQTIEAIRDYALSNAKLFFASAHDAEQCDDAKLHWLKRDPTEKSQT